MTHVAGLTRNLRPDEWKRFIGRGAASGHVRLVAGTGSSEIASDLTDRELRPVAARSALNQSGIPSDNSPLREEPAAPVFTSHIFSWDGTGEPGIS